MKTYDNVEENDKISRNSLDYWKSFDNQVIKSTF